MELTAIIASVDELERRIAVALAEEDYDSARALGEEVATLIRQIGARAATATAEEAAQIRAFAARYQNHADKMLAEIAPERERARQAIIKLHQGSRGRQNYASVRRGLN